MNNYYNSAQSPWSSVNVFFSFSFQNDMETFYNWRLFKQTLPKRLYAIPIKLSSCCDHNDIYKNTKRAQLSITLIAQRICSHWHFFRTRRVASKVETVAGLCKHISSLSFRKIRHAFYLKWDTFRRRGHK